MITSVDTERVHEIQNFLARAMDDPEVLDLLEFLETSGFSLPLILCDTEERIVNPLPSAETRVFSYQKAAVNHVMVAKFFSDGGEPVILDSSRKKVFPK